MTKIGKDVFFNFLVLDEKIELTKQSLQLIQQLQCDKYLVSINIKSAPNLKDCHALLYLFNNKTDEWDKVINLDHRMMVSPVDMDYEGYMNKFGNTISSTENARYFKAILAVMGTDRAALLRKAKQKFS